MKLSSPTFALFALAANLLQAKPIFADDHDDHDDHDDDHAESCACAAEELDFSMDCSDTVAMMEALTVIKTSGCSTDCSSPACEKNWYIVQAHHDYCDDSVIPNEIEDDFHDFDEVCSSCEIKRSFIEGAPSCPTPNCSDDSGNAAYVELVENDCSSDCSPDACRDAFFLLVATHDNCDHDVLSAAAEEGLHDFEDACTMHACNSGDGTDQLVCDEDHDDEHDDHDDEHDDHDDEHDDHDDEDMMTSEAAIGGTIGVGTILSAAVALIMT